MEIDLVQSEHQLPYEPIRKSLSLRWSKLKVKTSDFFKEKNKSYPFVT